MKHKLYLILCMTCLLLLTPLMSAPIYYKYSDRITNKFCSYMEKTHNLHCTANSGEFLYNVNNIHMSFSGTKNLSIEEARMLIVDGMQELLSRINTNVPIRPYLSHYPFTENDIDLLITLYNQDDEYVHPPFIAFALTYHDKISYETYNRKTQQFQTLLEEPYQIALAIVTHYKQMTPMLNQPEQVHPKHEVCSTSKIKQLYNFLMENIKHAK